MGLYYTESAGLGADMKRVGTSSTRVSEAPHVSKFVEFYNSVTVSDICAIYWRFQNKTK